MASERLPNKMTVEEYLAHEKATDIKHDYVDGNVFMFTGSSRNRIRLIVNCSAELREQLRDKSYRGFDSSMKVKISDTKYVYPAFSVVCHDTQYTDETDTILTKPVLIGEVMSPSSKDYDQGTKANFYRSLPSVQQYLLLNQDKAYAQLFTRNDLGWQLQEFEGLDALISLISIGCELKLSEAYLDVF